MQVTKKINYELLPIVFNYFLLLLFFAIREFCEYGMNTDHTYTF